MTQNEAVGSTNEVDPSSAMNSILRMDIERERAMEELAKDVGSRVVAVFQGVLNGEPWPEDVAHLMTDGLSAGYSYMSRWRAYRLKELNGVIPTFISSNLGVIESSLSADTQILILRELGGAAPEHVVRNIMLRLPVNGNRVELFTDRNAIMYGFADELVDAGKLTVVDPEAPKYMPYLALHDERLDRSEY